MSDDKQQAGEREGVLARVLGPDRPELSCEECFAQLDRYVELALFEDARPDEQVPRPPRRLPGLRGGLPQPARPGLRGSGSGKLSELALAAGFRLPG